MSIALPSHIPSTISTFPVPRVPAPSEPLNFPGRDIVVAVKDYAVQRVTTIAGQAMNGYAVSRTTLRNIGVGFVSLVALGTLLEKLERVLTPALEKLFGPQSFNQDAYKLFERSMGNPTFRYLTIAYIAVIAPIWEELTCRGDWQDGLRTYFDKLELPEIIKTLFMVVTSAALFGLIHLSPFQNISTNTLVLVVTFVMGLALSIMKELTGDLWAPTTTHVLYNSIALRQIWKAAHL